VGIVLIARSKVKKIANSEMNRDYIAVQNARFKLKNLMNLNLISSRVDSPPLGA